MKNSAECRNILIVEDYAESAETFKDLLEILGHQAKYVTSGVKALELIGQEKFDLVFMDINLPDMSGIDLLENLKNNQAEAIANTKFAAVSGYSVRDAQGLKATTLFDFYLEKPVDLASLDKILESLTSVEC